MDGENNEENNFSCAWTLFWFIGYVSNAAIFINEFHYDNLGGDVNEGIEIAATAGTDLSGFHLLLYNGSNGSIYQDILLDGVVSNQQGGFGVLFFTIAGMQNGPDGFALANSDGEVIQFLSYEGSFTATEGSALGMQSMDIGLFENSDTKPGSSLQLLGSGQYQTDFVWGIDEASRGAINQQQQFSAVPLPGALPLLITALGSLGAVSYRRNKVDTIKL